MAILPLLLAQGSLSWDIELKTGVPLTARFDVRDTKRFFLAQGDAGFSVYRGSTLLAKINVGALRGLAPMDLAQVGSKVFLALGDHFKLRGSKSGLACVDVSDPARPQVLSVWISDKVAKGANSIWADSERIYLSAMTDGIYEFDARQPARPTRHLELDQHFPLRNPKGAAVPNVRGVWRDGSTLFVAYDAGGLRAIELESGKVIGRYINEKMRGMAQAYNCVVVRAGIAYVAVDYAGIEVINVHDPATMSQVAWWNPWNVGKSALDWFRSAGHTNQIVLSPDGRTLYSSAGDSECLVLDVADPSHPKLKHSFGSIRDGRGSWGIDVHGAQALLTYLKAGVPFTGTWAGVKLVSFRTTPGG